VVKYALNPYLAVLRTIDSLATFTDESADAQDGVAATLVTLSAQPTAANGGYLYVGAPVPFRGLSVTMSADVNANASVLTVDYWDGSAWTALTNGSHGYVDGTISAGKTFGASGQIIWPTLPTDWATRQLVEGGTAPAQRTFYWVRLRVSAALSATVTPPPSSR